MQYTELVPNQIKRKKKLNIKIKKEKVVKI